MLSELLATASRGHGEAFPSDASSIHQLHHRTSPHSSTVHTAFPSTYGQEDEVVQEEVLANLLLQAAQPVIQLTSCPLQFFGGVQDEFCVYSGMSS